MKIKLVMLICVLALGASSAQAVQFLDTFDSGLSAYTATDVLVQGTNTPTYPTQFSIANDGLGNNYVDIVRSSGTYPEQQVLFRNTTLDIGETLRVDIKVQALTYYSDLGLAVGATVTPPACVYAGTNLDKRQNYFTMYAKDGSSGWGNVDFVGTTNVAGQNGFVTNQADYPNITGLWVYHKDVGVFDIGYTSSVNGDVQFRELTGVSWDTTGNGDAYVGLYTDFRQTTTGYGMADNLRIVPEPATAVMALVGALGMGLIWLRKRS